MKHDLYSANSIRLARVTYVHPAGQKMEVIFLDTGDYGRDVLLMSPYAGTDFGLTTGIAMPEKEGHAENMHDDPDRRHSIAVVASLQGMHVALGFLFPQITEMAFTKETDKNRLIERHPSDFYRTVSDAADMDMVHPGGAFIRVGQGKAPDDLKGRDYDKRWKLRHNTGSPATITLRTASSGSSQVTLEPGGDIASDASANMASTSGQATTVTAGSSVGVQSGTTTTLTSGAATAIAAGAAVSVAAATFIDMAALALTARFSDSSWSMGASGASMAAPFIEMTAQQAATINAPSIAINGNTDVVAQQSAAIRSPSITLEGITHIVGDIDI